LAGFAVFFSIPDFATHSTLKDKSTWQKLAEIDYPGALALVCTPVNLLHVYSNCISTTNILQTTTIVLFLYGLSGTIEIIPILLSIVSLLLFIAIEYRVAKDPIIPLSVLQNRGILLSCLAQLGFMAARWTILFYAPVFVLAVRGLGPALAGSVLIPTNAGFGTGGLLVGWLHVRRSGAFWMPSLVSLLLFGVTLSSLAWLSTSTASAALYLIAVFLNGLCTGAALNYTLAHLLHLAPVEMHFVATGLLSTFRGFAGSFGTAIGGGIFVRTLRGALVDGYERLDGGGPLNAGREELIKKLIGSPALVFSGGLSDAENAVAVLGYESALRILYTSAAVLCILVLLLQAGTGWADPVSQEEEEEIEEAVLEHNGTMEA
jgi:hypothetical protein